VTPSRSDSMPRLELRWRCNIRSPLHSETAPRCWSVEPGARTAESDKLRTVDVVRFSNNVNWQVKLTVNSQASEHK
jgi:hypothetical protein